MRLRTAGGLHRLGPGGMRRMLSLFAQGPSWHVALEETDMSDTFRTIKDRPILWTDADGVVHRCAGADVHPGVRLLWTGCNRDVPAGNAYLPGARDGVTCPTCISVMP